MYDVGRTMGTKKIIPLVLITLILTMGLFPPVHAPYRDYSLILTAFKTLANTYPKLMTYESVGKTSLGNDMIMFKIGNPRGGRVLLDGGMHGSETIGGELLYLYAKWLLTSSDTTAKTILSRDYTLIIPAVNVDRYNRARKNANGVDLNRNFAAEWEYSGSGNPESETYRGPSPLSEPESRALVAVFLKYKPSFYVNLHMWAGPYYAGSVYGNRTYYSYLVSKISTLSRNLGVSPFPYHGEFGGGGMAISDAAVAGVTSFLIELTTAVPPFSEIETVFLPKFIPVAAILSQECELLFESDDFESGDFRAWSGVTVTSGDSATVVNTNPLMGVYSAKFQTEAIDPGTKRAYVYKNIQETPLVYARGFFKIVDGLPLIDTNDRFTLIQFLSTAGGVICSLQVRKAQGKDTFTLLTFANEMQTAANTFPKEDTWYCLELFAKIHATEGSFKAYINGVEQMTSVGTNTTAFGNVGIVRFGLANSIDTQQRVLTAVDSTAISTEYIGPALFPLWDANQDGWTNILDLTIVSPAFGSIPESPNWDPRADVNRDDIVSFLDLLIVAIHLGEEYT